MFKSLLFLLCTISFLSSADIDTSNNTGFSGHLQLMHVLYGKDNGFDPETGSSIGLNLRYTSEDYFGFKGIIGFHYVGDTGLTDLDKDSSGDYIKKVAGGIFLTPDYSGKAVLDEVLLQYSYQTFTLGIGRRHPPETMPKYFANPIALFKDSQVENSYEAISLRTEYITDTTIGITHIIKMMPGSRSNSDYGIIGEYTNTAGIAVNPIYLEGKFVKIADLALTGGKDANGNQVKTPGMTKLTLVNRSLPDTTLQLWNYYVYDFVNFLFLQSDHTMKHDEFTATVKLQYLREDGIGEKYVGDIDASMWGAMLLMDKNLFSASISYNQSYGEFFNAWGFDPAFTSSLFSRNAYRDDVKAYKVAMKYKFSKHLVLSWAYADYGRSESYGGNPSRTLYPTRDATEMDTVLNYKVNKELNVKFYNVLRTSEYESTTSDRKQNQWRLIATYRF